MHYTLKDHQGSLAAVVRGNTVERLSYDPWGRRRNTSDFGYDNVSHTFDRGYTLHEHYDEFDLINMNGRMYDPITSSFLSVDQYVGSPENAQGFNRYAYCSNNPLRYVDPSGWLQVGGGASGYTPNSATNDPYAYAEHGSLLEPRDLGLRQLSTTDPVITWMEGNERHGGGSGAKGGEPIIDPSNLTPSQQQGFEKVVSFFKDNSSLFEKVYICLSNSETVYTITIGETYQNLPAQFLSNNNTIVFRDEESLVSCWPILEEMFHAYQLSENKSLYDPQKEFNYEFEAKVAVFLMVNQLNYGNRNMTGTNFERMSTFLSPNGEDVVFPTAQSIQGRDFLNGYYEGARFFRNWNIFYDYGNENYKKATLQTPKSLFKLFKP